MSASLPFNVDNMKWEIRMNVKGMFEVSSDVDNPDHKALLKFLNQYGSLPSQGYFYWIFTDGRKIGRKHATQRQRQRFITAQQVGK